MGFIKRNNIYAVGSKVEAIEDIESCSGKFTKGTLLTITGECENRGFDVSDEHGNKMTEVLAKHLGPALEYPFLRDGMNRFTVEELEYIHCGFYRDSFESISIYTVKKWFAEYKHIDIHVSASTTSQGKWSFSFNEIELNGHFSPVYSKDIYDSYEQAMCRAFVSAAWYLKENKNYND